MTIIDTRVMIVSEYMRGDTLQKSMELKKDSNGPVNLIVLYIQIMAGLKWLESNFIIHRHIRPAVILVDPQNEQHCFSGLSEFCISPTRTGIVNGENYRTPEIKNSSIYDAKIDVYSLSAVIHAYLLSRSNLSMLLNSEIENLKGLENDPAQRPNVLQICDMFNGLVNGYEWPSFKKFSMTRIIVMSILFDNDGNDPQFIQTSDFLKIFYFYPTNAATILLLEKQIIVAGVCYNHLKNAKKVCQNLELAKLKENLDFVYPGVDRATYL